MEGMKVETNEILLLGKPKIRNKTSQILLEIQKKEENSGDIFVEIPEIVIVRNHKRRRKHVIDLRFENRRAFDCCFPRNWATLRNKKQFKLLDEYLTRKVLTFDHF